MDPFVRNAIGVAVREVNKSPSDLEVRRRLCMVYEANGMFEVADRCYEQVLEMEPRSAKSWFRLARTRERQGRIEDAIEAMQASLASDSSFAPSHWLLGLWLTDLGRFEEAAAALEEAVRLDPEDRSVWLVTARLQLARDEPAAAIETLREHAFEGGDNQAYGRFLLARGLRGVGRVEEARELLNQGETSRAIWRESWSSELDPLRTGRAHLARIVSRWMKDGRLEEARKLLERLAEIDPKDHRVVTLKSQYLLKIGNGEQALRLLLDALEEQPDRQVLHLNVAVVSLSLSRTRPELLATAVEHARRAVELKADSGEAQKVLAMVWLQQGAFDEGISALEQAYELGAITSEELRRFGDSFVQAHRPEVAERIFEIAEQNGDEAG